MQRNACHKTFIWLKRLCHQPMPCCDGCFQDGTFPNMQNSVRDCPHQYIERGSGAVKTEHFIADPLIAWLYSQARERHPYLFKLATQRHGTRLLAYLNYEAPLVARNATFHATIAKLGIDESECVVPFGRWPKLRDIFERQIRFSDVRPLPESSTAVASPADSRILFGRFSEHLDLPVKEKFFSLNELLGKNKVGWQFCFGDGDWAIFRLTPEKYHYNHMPVSGKVVDVYEIDGDFHSCNPSAIVRMVTPYSKNRRCVSVIDTDVNGGTQIGCIAMIEVVALMIGEIVQCYSDERYSPAAPIEIGQFVRRGAVKSLFRPGSSTVILLFQRDRVVFDYDLVKNARRRDVQSRFSHYFGECLVETDVAVRSSIAKSVTHVPSAVSVAKQLFQLEKL